MAGAVTDAIANAAWGDAPALQRVVSHITYPAGQVFLRPAHHRGVAPTLGSTANQNGTALYEGVTVLFLALFFGVHLSLGAQATVVRLSIFSGVGTAGVPSEGIGTILGVDRLLDMCRKVLNVTGDVLTACYVTRAEGHPLRS